MSSPLPSDVHARVEGARYALLRRLAPALRHDAVATLQPIAMATCVLERRLREPAPDLALVQDTATRLAGYSRSAVQSCLDLIEWLAPTPQRGVSLRDAVPRTVQLLRGSLSLRGFTLRDELQDTDAQVGHPGLCYVLPACLLWLTDSAGSPAQVTLRANDSAQGLRLVLDLHPSVGEPGVHEPPAYRPLHAQEVADLAQAEGITLERQGDTLALTLTRATA